jgi:hypothetical protein
LKARFVKGDPPSARPSRRLLRNIETNQMELARGELLVLEARDTGDMPCRVACESLMQLGSAIRGNGKRESGMCSSIA